MAIFPLTSVGLRFHSLLVKEFGQSKPSERGECDSWKEMKPLFIAGEHINSQNGGQAHPDCRGMTEGRKPNLLISQCASLSCFFSPRSTVRSILCFCCALKFISLSHLYKYDYGEIAAWLTSLVDWLITLVFQCFCLALCFAVVHVRTARVYAPLHRGKPVRSQTLAHLQDQMCFTF